MPANEARPWRRRWVDQTGELRRVKALPRRSWAPADLDTLRHAMTAVLRTTTGTMVLNTAQGLALHDIGEFGGLIGPIRVGGGKTIISLMAPYVLEARRPLLLAPASLLAKTTRERQDLQKHWRIPRNIQMRSYEVLGRVNAADDLKRINPDLIVADEAHKLKNKKAGVTRRVVRFMRENPGVRFVAISGTLMKDSIKDFAHIMRWALKAGAPVPEEFGNLEEWADALDEKVNPLRRMEPGALLELCQPEDYDDDEPEADRDVRAARRGFRRRMVETPGVVCTAGEDVNASLTISPIILHEAPGADARYKTLRTLWETPDGYTFLEAILLWQYARQLALGFHSVWDPPAPDKWRDARKGWGTFVRETLKHSRYLDTPKQVAMECEKGGLDDTAFREWTAAQPLYTPNPRPVWHDDIALGVCQEWLKRGPGIVWTEHAFFAHELSRRSGAPYFGAEGKDRNGRMIEDASGPVIASRPANGTGRNLQFNWSRNLITDFQGSCLTVEQQLGRTHRKGQEADTVEVDVLIGCREQWAALVKALANARTQRDTIPGAESQKLLIADITWPEESEIAAMPGYRWRQTSDLPKNAELIADSPY